MIKNIFKFVITLAVLVNFTVPAFVVQVSAQADGYGTDYGYSNAGYGTDYGYSNNGYGTDYGYSNAGYGTDYGYSNNGYGTDYGYSNAGYGTDYGYSNNGYGTDYGYSNAGYGTDYGSSNNNGYGTDYGYSNNGYGTDYGYSNNNNGYGTDYGYSNNGYGTDYGYSTPSYTTPTYTAPVYTTPTYTSPTYTSPTYTSPVYTSPVYTTPTVYTPPVYTPVTTNPITIPVTSVTRCSDGSLPSPTFGCTHTTTIPIVNTTVCSDGSIPSSVFGCTHTNTLPVVNNTVCADGSLPSSVFGCTHTNTLPVVNNIVCSDGSYPINGSCTHTVTYPTVNYQTCWDGSTISLYSTCPAQYKVCPNGTSVSVNQACYYNYSPTPTPYVPPVVIKFNNVITSVATEITTASARCNGIGLIASNAPSTGWFEYGETPNLGRETAKANIGSSATAPFSNVLANLKPTTTYYCRAVMQNQFGTVKGEVVAFTTKSKAVSYVKPVTKTVTYAAAKPVTKKKEIVCTDGTVVSGGSAASTNMINNGQKLISLQVEKVSGNLAPGSVVSYRLGFKNLASDALKGVTIKVTVPQEIAVTQASSGAYDATTHTLTATIPSLPAGAEGAIAWTGSVDGATQVGKTLAMTGYASYTVPGTTVQDEVSAYTVGTVVPAVDGNAPTGAKNVIGATSVAHIFLPSSLVEWLALIAIIFIIFILARSVYMSYKEEKREERVTH